MSRHDEDGFTLLEVMIAVAVLGIVMVSLGAAFIMYFQTADKTADKLAESPNLQMAASYFASDSQSSDTTLAVQDCLKAGQTAMVSFRWHDPGTIATEPGDDRNIVVSYVMVTSAGVAKSIVRNRCVGTVGDANSIGTPDAITVVHVIDPAIANTTYTPPVASPPAAVATPATISVSMCTPNQAGTACKRPADTYHFSLTGSRRQ